MVHRQRELAAPAFHDRLAVRRCDTREAAQTAAAGVLATDIDELRRHAAACTRCPLHCNATRTVFGEGPPRADLMVVGEQPGDIEDLTGRPFTGPAGQLLGSTLAELGVEREKLWLTNAVKHFKFVARGKKRLHQRPNRADIDHCRWWLKREIELVRPKLILALGATAVESLTGKRASVTALRGQLIDTLFGVRALVTWHPAYLLRLPDPARATAAAELFQRDIGKASEMVSTGEMVPPAGIQKSK
jgi:DNA polymerase